MKNMKQLMAASKNIFMIIQVSLMILLINYHPEGFTKLKYQYMLAKYFIYTTFSYPGNIQEGFRD